MKNQLTILFLMLAPVAVMSQNPAPALPVNKRILFTGAIAHTGTGVVIPNSAIGIENGKLKLVADATLIRINRSEYDTIIDVQGKHIYPGLIALNTSLGLNEIEAVRATGDTRETGTVNPSARTIIAYNTDSKITPTVRSNGVLTAQIVPEGELLAGQSSVVSLDAWNFEDATYKADEGLHLNWPSMRVYKAWWAEPEEKQKEKSTRELTTIHQLFADAKAYAVTANPSPTNLSLEAMKGLFTGKKKLYVHCDYVKEIIAAVTFCSDMGITMVLVGGTDAYLVADLLKEHKVPVVLMNPHRLPSRDDEDVDMPYKLPALLTKAGVETAIAVGGFWQVRNLPFQAGNVAGYGLSLEEVLSAVTIIPARILGIDSSTGSLEPGKDATILISSGDLFDMKSSNVEQALIAGKWINLDNIQKQLYRKFSAKYGIKSE